MSQNIGFKWIVIFLIIFLFINCSMLLGQSPIDPNAQVKEIATNIQQPEGPVWKNGVGLLFSDIRGNKIYQWTSENGKKIFLDPSNNTNGLTYDMQGRLLAGQMGLRRIVRFEKNGTQTSLADKYEGKKLSSPNDLVVKSDGAIFFTDPDFNIPWGQQKELDFNGIYRISSSGELQLLDKSLALPNGICFSPDESKLYVNDSQVHKIYEWDVVDDSTITNKKLLFTIPTFGYADGMKIDKDGNIYCTCSSAVWVVSPAGELLGKIDLPSNASASNCAWGEEDNLTLFITAGSSVYKVRPLATSVKNQKTTLPRSLQLYQNFPNPFNPSTTISFNLTSREVVSLTIYNTIGKEIEILVDGVLPAGHHAINWIPSNIPSGLYFYEIQAGNFHETKKMIYQN